VSARASGRSFALWIGPRHHARHAARIWIDNRAVVSVEDNPPQVLAGELNASDLDAVRRYIALNRAAILDHWHERTDRIELARTRRRGPEGAREERLGEAGWQAWGRGGAARPAATGAPTPTTPSPPPSMRWPARRSQHVLRAAQPWELSGAAPFDRTLEDG